MQKGAQCVMESEWTKTKTKTETEWEKEMKMKKKFNEADWNFHAIRNQKIKLIKAWIGSKTFSKSFYASIQSAGFWISFGIVCELEWNGKQREKTSWDEITSELSWVFISKGFL